MDLQKTVPRMKECPELGSLADWIDRDGLLVMLHDESPIRGDGTSEQAAQFVSCFAVVDRDVDTVRERVQNFSEYENMITEVDSARVKTAGEKQTRVEYDLRIETPVIDPHFTYTVEYRPTDDGDLLFEDVEGDFEHVVGRWEFVEIDGKTLMVYTVWNDFSNLGWTFKTIFWAQPDLKITMPMTQASVLTEQIRSSLSDGTEKPSSVEDLPDEPDVPRLANRDIPRAALVNLAENGTLMYVHPLQWIRDGDRALDLRFVSGIGLMEASLEDTKVFSTEFERYPEFIDQVSQVESEETPDGFNATWTLDLGINILALSLSYSLEYTWEDDTTLSFRRTGGDLQHVYGALEWEAVNDDRTLFFYTPATQIGQDDSLLVRLAEAIPNRQIVIGVSAGALAVKHQAEWIKNQARA